MRDFRNPRYKVLRNREECIKCDLCVRQCANEVHYRDKKTGALRADSMKCVNCQRCTLLCPTRALAITRWPQVDAGSAVWTESAMDDITAQAQTEAADMIAKAKAAIEAEKKQAISELQATVADTSVDVAARLIGEDLTEGEHRAIIERFRALRTQIDYGLFLVAQHAAIAALNKGLEAVKCNVLVASHDHQLIQTVCNRVFDFTPEGQLIDRKMTYDEYLEMRG